MEGPTPVSALIHAATMVAAGVYMLCRVIFIFTPEALHMIGVIGGITALLAALIAVQQNDIKRILAYSTLSQLGYMVMAVGLNGPTSAMFHLTTHAFFKALLFLGAGSVIVTVHHEQDIWNMGGLRKKMPATFWTFMVGTLALAGLWPFSGFFSKDSILSQALHGHRYGLFTVAVLVAVLTTFYMFRLVFIVFYGSKRSSHADHAHESPGVMVWPLRILAVLSLIGGIIGIEAIYNGQFTDEVEHANWAAQLVAPFIHAPIAALAGLAALAVGFGAAWKLYAKADRDPLTEKFPRMSRWMRNRFFFDEFYQATFIRLHDTLASIADRFERWILVGSVRGVHGTTEFVGRALTLLQSGNLQFYAFLFALGVAVLMFFILGK
jgi:NADH-quinone oxidoreductase subunit L